MFCWGEIMTEKQVEKYRAYLKQMIEEKANKLHELDYSEIKEFLQGKVEAYTIALAVFNIILNDKNWTIVEIDGG